MALEMLKDLEMIDGFKVTQIGPGMENDVKEETKFITIDHTTNDIEFQMQRGPIREVGVNGCQVDTLISTAKQILIGFNNKIPCKENETIIEHLSSALQGLKSRKLDREIRGVEGTSKA